jgi:hypothetical protein
VKAGILFFKNLPVLKRNYIIIQFERNININPDPYGPGIESSQAAIE